MAIIATAVDFMGRLTTEVGQPVKSSSMAKKILLCFSLPANVDRLLRTGRPKDVIGCLDGMRLDTTYEKIPF